MQIHVIIKIIQIRSEEIHSSRDKCADENSTRDGAILQGVKNSLLGDFTYLQYDLVSGTIRNIGNEE